MRRDRPTPTPWTARARKRCPHRRGAGRWALDVPLIVGTFCLTALETYERGQFELVGAPYQGALSAALLFLPGVILVTCVRTKLCWSLATAALIAAPLIGSVRTIQRAGVGLDAFAPYLTTVLVLGVSAAVLAAAAEIVLRPDDHPLVRRLVRQTLGPAGGASATTGFLRTED